MASDFFDFILSYNIFKDFKPIESRPEKYFEDAGTRTWDLSTKHTKRVLHLFWFKAFNPWCF